MKDNTKAIHAEHERLATTMGKHDAGEIGIKATKDMASVKSASGGSVNAK